MNYKLLVILVIVLLTLGQYVLADDNELANVYYQSGMALVKEGKYEEAIQALRTAVSLDSMSAGTWHLLARTQRHAANPDEAHKAILKALRYDPSQRNYRIEYFNIGSLYQAQGQTDRALAIYQEVAKTAPGFVDVYLNLGILLSSVYLI